MSVINKKAGIMLIFGDLVFFVVSLWLALILRRFSFPTFDVFVAHLAPFVLLFAVWLITFFISGLYDRDLLLMKSRVPGRIAIAQSANFVIAILFFYLVPIFGIAPKATLFLAVIVTSAFVFLWRLVIFPAVYGYGKVPAVFIGNIEALQQLKDRCNASAGSAIHVIDIYQPQMMDDQIHFDEWIKQMESRNIGCIAADLGNPQVAALLPGMYDLIYKGIRFFDVRDLYEQVFGKEPLPLMDEAWIMNYASLRTSFAYDVLKRGMDIILSFIVGLISLIVYPFVYIAIKLDDGGPIFIFQERVGKNNKPINIVKFRSMSQPKSDSGEWVKKNDARITRVGKFLRKSRIDELPQLWNVLIGEVSLIGPRPELPKLVEFYKKEIPHYNVRHLITPGLSGWAQIHHDIPPHSTEETKVKLAYDLFYIKHRSFMLDLQIALKTIATLIKRTGV